MGVKILILCETTIISSVVKHAIVNNPHIHMEVLGSTTRLRDAQAYIEQGNCDILLIHARLKKHNSREAVKRFAADYPELDLVVFGLPQSKQLILPYLEDGASGYILQDDTVPQMLKKIIAVHKQRPIIDPEITGSLVNRLSELAHARHGATIANGQSLAELTPREKEVLALLGEQLSNREIAQRLFIEVGTVKNHVHRLLKKLGVHSRHDAAAYLPILKNTNDFSVAV